MRSTSSPAHRTLDAGSCCKIGTDVGSFELLINETPGRYCTQTKAYEGGENARVLWYVLYQLHSPTGEARSEMEFQSPAEGNRLPLCALVCCLLVSSDSGFSATSPPSPVHVYRRKNPCN